MHAIIVAVFTALPHTFIAATIAEIVAEVTKGIVALTTLVAAISAMIIALRNGRKTDDLRIKVDGQLEKLLTVTGASEHAKGVIQGGMVGRAEGRVSEAAEGARRREARAEGRAAGVEEGEKRREAHDVGIIEGKIVVAKIEEIR